MADRGPRVAVACHRAAEVLSGLRPPDAPARLAGEP